MRPLHILIVFGGLLLLGASGCEKPKEVVMPPVPDPRYLSRPIKTPESEKPSADQAAQAEGEAAPTGSAAPVPPGGRSPEEVAAEVREVVARLQAAEVGREKPLRKLGPDESPPLREGEPPAKVVAAVPMEADEPIRRPEGSPGDVHLTEIAAVELNPSPPVPPVDNSATKPATQESPTPAAADAAPGEPPEGDITLENLTKRYEALASEHPGDAEMARTLRFLHFLNGNDAGSLEAIPGLAPEEQSVWHWMMASLIAARDRVPGMSRADQAAEILDDIERVRAVLRQEAALELGEVRFCHEINYFGDYKPLEVNRFRPGEQAKLYAELRNYPTVKGEDGLYRVRLNVALSLERSDGTSVWQETIPGVEDVCRRPRQDFFLRIHFPVPADAAPGAYVLKATFEDATSRKQAGARLELEVATR